jgi:hypothetical protein
MKFKFRVLVALKDEFTMLNDHFGDKHNAEVGLHRQTQIGSWLRFVFFYSSAHILAIEKPGASILRLRK